jgi:gliding motility-associated-like protein
MTKNLLSGKLSVFTTLIMMLWVFVTNAQTVELISTSGAGTWTVPCGVNSITVEVWGGGGGGGGSTDQGGGGGGGACYNTQVIAVIPGQILNYSIGTGGVGLIGADGTDGLSSFFDVVTANGGLGGRAGAATPGLGGLGCVGGTVNGDNGADGTALIGGNGGNGGNGGVGGAGGVLFGGSAAAPGGGGGAAASDGFSNGIGGSGADGQIRITYVQVPAEPTISPSGPISFCNGGSVILTSSIAPEYLWSTGATTQSINVSTSGTYTVSVTDLGCTVASAPIVVNVNPIPDFPTIDSFTHPNCNGPGIVYLSNLPPTGTWVLTESLLGTTVTGTGTTAVFSGMANGTYSFTVRTDSGCTSIPSLPVTLNPPIAGPVLEITFDVVYCTGDSTGFIEVIIAGGTDPVSFVWSNGATTVNQYDLPAGTYSITATDAVGCSVTDDIVITEPATALSVTSSATDILCFGQTSTLSANAFGGTGSYYYNWSNGSFLQNTTTLVAGTYFVTVYDDYSCIAIDTVTVNGPALPLSISVVSQVNVNCFGDLGEITVTGAGGTGSYIYDWSDGQFGPTAVGLIAGVYTVTVTDDNGCEAFSNITITGPASPLVASITSQTDVLCNGGATGALSVSVAGGTPAYSILWSGGQTSFTLNGLVAGTYTATITDINSCQDTVLAIITEPALALSSTFNSVGVLCFGETSGFIDAFPSGGTPAYSFNWSTGATTSTITGLIAGVYSLTITDNNSCEFISTVSVSGPTQPLAISIDSQIDVICFGDLGSATVSASGGIGSYIFDWSDGQSGNTAINLLAGIYSVSVTDDNGCIASTTVTINGAAAALSASISAQSDVLCFGENSGTATVTALGGSGLYNYLWSDGQTTALATGLAAGSYTVTVSDANGCTTTVVASVTISAPAAALSAAISSQTDVLCFGEISGTATVTASGGSNLYNYLWLDGQTTALATGLAAGSYTVTVSDANGCTTTVVASVTISAPAAALSAAISAQTDVLCFGESTGTATVTASGGSNLYNYLWLDGQTTALATGLAAGSYTVTVSDANGCTTTVVASVTISAPAAALSASISAQTDVLCFGESTGTATVTASGGSNLYNYLWLDGQTTALATGLAAGSYTVTVSDANGCTTTVVASVTINAPAAALSAAISSQTDVLCFGEISGTATVTASGGSNLYNYLWLDGQTTALATGLAAGSYTVTVSDSNGCTTTVVASVTISAPAAALSASISAQTNVLCFGESTGTATVTASGGSNLYNYLWSDGQTTALATGLAAGANTVTVSDANGCTTTVVVSVTISAPAAALSASISAQTNVLCFGENTGSATVSVSGGSGSYSYIWSTIPAQFGTTATALPSGSYSVTVSDLNGCTATQVSNVTITGPGSALSAFISSQTNVLCFAGTEGSATISASGGSGAYNYIWSTIPAQTTATATGLAVGSYNITVSDANGCTSTIVGLNVVINGPTVPLTAPVTQTNVLCFGEATGSATVSAAGGSGFYSYLWNTGHTGTTISNLPVGVYSVLVSDANGCSATVITTVTITGPSIALSAAISAQTDVLCFGQSTGSATVTASGGSGAYGFVWSDGQTGPIATGLAAGNYNVTLTDLNGCTVSASTSLTITEPAAAVNAAISAQTDVICFGDNTGTATVNALGGTGAYTYLWSNSQNTQTATALGVGVHSVTVTDFNGCTLSASASVTISGPSNPITASMTAQTNVLCFGDSTGTATVTALGGSGLYNYLWSTLPIQTTNIATGLAGGNYSVTVSDNNGCSATAFASVLITTPGLPLSISISAQTDVLCFGGSTGSAAASAAGGSGIYSFEWSTADVGSTVNNLSAAIYTVTVTDGNGCEASTSVTITEPPTAPTATVVSFSDVSCFGETTGSASVAAVGGAGTYSYFWSNGATSNIINNLAAGNYYITVTDINGCFSVDSVQITQPAAALTLSVISTVDAICFGSSEGGIVVNASGGTPNYTYLWSNSMTTATITGLSANTFVLTVTDNNNCTATVSALINEPAQVTVPVVALVNQTTCVSAVGSINFSGLPAGNWTLTESPGGTILNGSGTTAVFGNLAPGVYSFIVTDAAGCSSVSTANITINSQLILDCDGDGVNDGDEIANGTDPLDPCDYLQSSVTMPQGGSWAIADCDGDGVTNANETIDGTNIFDPCSYIATSITQSPNLAWTLLDCDGDGVPNGVEASDGTNPLDPCNFIITSVSVAQSASWLALDCDGDGVPNGTELNDGTDIFNQCSFVLSSISQAPSASWNAFDCDGDGVINGTEIANGTNPLNPCSFISSSITLPQGGLWNNFDCDGDGVTNGTEIIDGTDPYDFCSFVLANVTQPFGTAFNAADCDGDGVPNSSEISSGTNPLDPCDYNPALVVMAQSVSWNALDCDGDGVTNGTEIIDGTNPQNPCDYIPANITLVQGGAWNTVDCDGDGVINSTEIIDGTDPLDFCSFQFASVTLLPSTAWNNADCDGDGVTNATELADGTDIFDPCSFVFANITLTPGGDWNNEDCDGDGVLNGIEVSDLTDPNDPCSFVSSSITETPTGAWNNADCDGDGVTNGTEIADGTNPNDPCSLILSSVTLVPGGDWNNADCDGDGVINATEISDGTNPYDPCSFNFGSITILPNISWAGLDCDGDGVTNGSEALDGTDPEDPCSYNPESITVAPSGDWLTADCDGDGVPNAIEVADSTNPQDPCSFILSSVSLTPSTAWQTADCDGDGVSNADEVTAGTNPLDACDYNPSDVTLVQGGLWASLDCDGDGVINAFEADDETDPFDPCSFVLASQTVNPVAEWYLEDCDNDGINNGDEIAQGSNPLDPCSPRSCDLNLPEGFSPNGDGVNDNYVIRGLHLYPNNSFTVFNRWGNMVYKAEPYNNQWDGTSTVGLSIGGDQLPTGVYFYIFDLGDGTKPFKGYIYLNREN